MSKLHSNRFARASIVAASLLAIAGAAISLAGPLDPPAGPVGSTYKTLNEVEPRTPIQSLSGNASFTHRITSAGSYYLTGNLSVAGGVGGIEVVSDNVTIDLNGFRVLGSTGSGDGIFAGAGIDSLTIRNGTVTSMGGDGIEAQGRRLRVENVTSTGHAGRGIALGDAAIITGVIADNNGGIGIEVSNDAVVENCVATANATEGIAADVSCTVRGCTAVGNATFGIRVGLSGSVLDCTVKDQTPAGSRGIVAGQGSVVSRCAARNITGTGIWLEDSCSAIDNVVSFNAAGILAFGNNGNIERNQISNCGTAGVRMDGSDIRVVGNNFTDNDIGVQTVGAGGNIVFHNTFSGNTTSSSLGASDRFGFFRALAAGQMPAATDYNDNLVY